MFYYFSYLTFLILGSKSRILWKKNLTHLKRCCCVCRNLSKSKRKIKTLLNISHISHFVIFCLTIYKRSKYPWISILNKNLNMTLIFAVMPSVFVTIWAVTMELSGTVSGSSDSDCHVSGSGSLSEDSCWSGWSQSPHLFYLIAAPMLVAYAVNTFILEEKQHNLCKLFR